MTPTKTPRLKPSPGSATAELAASQPLVVDYRGAGRLCGLHAETIARLCRRGELPHVKVGRAVRIRVADLDAWLYQRSRAEEGRA